MEVIHPRSNDKEPLATLMIWAFNPVVKHSQFAWIAFSERPHVPFLSRCGITRALAKDTAGQKLRTPWTCSVGDVLTNVHDFSQPHAVRGPFKKMSCCQDSLLFLTSDWTHSQLPAWPIPALPTGEEPPEREDTLSPAPSRCCLSWLEPSHDLG